MTIKVFLYMSFPQKRESSKYQRLNWIPAFAGMTVKENAWMAVKGGVWMIKRRILHLLLSLTLALSCIDTATAQSAQPHAERLVMDSEDTYMQEAIDCIMKGDFKGAVDAANNSSDPQYVLGVVEVLRIYNNPNAIPLSSAVEFLNKYEWVPKEVFLPKIERSINHDINPKDTAEWFAFQPPYTKRGKFFLLHAKIRLGQEKMTAEHTRVALRKLWHSTEFEPATEEYLINQYKDIFTIDDLFKKIDHCIWNGNTTFAKKLIDLLPNKNRAFFGSKLEVAQRPNSVVRYFGKNLTAQDEFIKYTYIKQALKTPHEGVALKQLITIKPQSHFERWWKLKNVAFREAILNGNYQQAYSLTRNHGLEEGAEFADAQWYGGWVALEFLKRPQSAIQHFKSMYDKTKLATSKSKAAFWTARAYQKAGDSKTAKHWYTQASIYSSTFYGQLAIAQVYGASKYNYFTQHDKKRASTQASKDNIKKATLLAYHLFKAGQKMLAYDIINYIPSLDVDKVDIESAAFFFNKRALHPLAVELGKASANRAFILIEGGYPRDIKFKQTTLPKALYLAVIRQESNFDHMAISPAGARGLMQLMPETAAKLAKRLGIPTESYIHDPQANVNKGVAYIDELYGHYNNLILTIAAYNAGPGNVKKWIESIGDPRTMNSLEQKIDWIEMIPFAETRSYVKKVMENMIIYDSLLNPSHNAKTIIRFLEL